MSIKFLLRSSHPKYPDISLPDGVEFILGRNILTKNKDFRLSRRHVSFKANNKDNSVELRQLGANPSFCLRSSGEKLLRRGHSTILRSGEALELLTEKYKYDLVDNSKQQTISSLSDSSLNRSSLNSRFGGGMEPYKNHWSQALYAMMDDPQMVEFDDGEIVIIKDNFPKARHHFLVLPREKLTDLSYLNESHAPLIRRMIDQAKVLAGKRSMGSYKMGFHCVPSMAQVHMHLISDDFDSPCLKNKKHWNSFNSEYFIPADEVARYLEVDGSVPFDQWRENSKNYLAMDLRCHKCDFKPKNLPDLKRHIVKHFE